MSEKISRRNLLGLGLSAASLASLSACASIPWGGPVNHYADTTGDTGASSNSATPQGPVEGASPQDIIEGFFRAGTGSDNDYEIARQFLTPDTAESWRADSQTLVYTEELRVESGQETGEYSVTVRTKTQVNASGLATSYAETNEQQISLVLEQVEGQWRIAQLPDGLVLGQQEFDQSFAPFTLYFYDATFTYAVPDIRWFADRPSVSTSMVRVLTEGPAPYLQNAVRSAIPGGSELTRNSVPVEGTVAQVSLTGDALTSDMSQLDIARIHTQLTQTLTLISGIDSVSLSFDNESISAGELADYIAPQVNPAVPKNVVAVDGSDLILRSEVLNEDSTSTVYTSSNETVVATAMDYSRQNFAHLNPSRSELFLVRNGNTDTILSGEGLTTPSFDQFQWLWSGDSEGNVRAVPFASEAETEAVDITASWLLGAHIRSLRISRDGSRAAIVAVSGDTSYLWVSGVQRDSNNRPTALNEPVRVGTSIDIQYALWSSDQALIAANFDTGETEQAYLTGELTAFDRLDALSQVSACIGGDQVIAQTSNQNIYLLVDRGWSRVETSAHEISFSC